MLGGTDRRSRSFCVLHWVCDAALGAALGLLRSIDGVVASRAVLRVGFEPAEVSVVEMAGVAFEKLIRDCKGQRDANDQEDDRAPRKERVESGI